MKIVRDSVDADKKQTLWSAVKGQKDGLKYLKDSMWQHKEQTLSKEYAEKMETKKKQKEDLAKKKK